jgi:glycosyltransferase involved in cell wall biosynthesis
MTTLGDMATHEGVARSARMPITVVVLTYNEEPNLGDCLSSVYRWADHIFVVDSGSSDGTREIAAHFGAELVQHPFETHTRQWDWALETLPIQSEWVLALDADQRATPELAREISGLDSAALDGVDGIYIKRRQIFRDKWIKHGGYYPKYLLKMFRRGSVKTDARDLVDHHFYVTGKTIKLRRDLLEVNKKEDDISFWIDKHNRYAALLAKEELENKRTYREHILAPSFLGKPDQQSLMLKKVWSGLPLYFRPFLYFLYRYFLRLGFLDGKEGAIFHFLHAFWFRLLVDIKLDELQKQGARG